MLKTSTIARTESRASSYHDAEDDTSGISRSHLDPDAARSQFLPSRVDARDADFSDRIDSRRRAYRVSSRKRAGGDDNDEDSDGSTADEETTSEDLKRKFAKLLRQAEELKSEVERRKLLAKEDDKTEDQLDNESLGQLSAAIKTLDSIEGGRGAAEARLANRLNAVHKLPQQPPNTNSVSKGQNSDIQTPPAAAVSLAASFDSRLHALETALGIQKLPLPTQSTTSPGPILPTLISLSQKISILSSASPTSLESLTKRVRQLTVEAETLAEKRKAARTSYEELQSSGSDLHPGTYKAIEDQEQVSKIAALYGTLPTIEALAPLLPSVLDRLRSLRLVHAGAADAGARMDEVEKRGTEMRDEVKRWREGVEEVEGKVEEMEKRARGNLGVIENWVKDLESRIESLEKN